MENLFNDWRNTKYKYLPLGDFYGNHPQTWEDKNEKKCINCNKLQKTFINTSLAYFLPESTNLFLHIFKHFFWHICDIFITCLMVSSECLKCLLSKLYRDEAATFPDISNKTILVKSSPCWCSWTSVSSRKYHGMLSSKYVLLPALISFWSGDLLHSASNPFERRDKKRDICTEFNITWY